MFVGGVTGTLVAFSRSLYPFCHGYHWLYGLKRLVEDGDIEVLEIGDEKILVVAMDCLVDGLDF